MKIVKNAYHTQNDKIYRDQHISVACVIKRNKIKSNLSYKDTNHIMKSN